MLEVDYKLLHRVTHGGKTLYCGYVQSAAARVYYEQEPTATHKSPLVWRLFLVPNATAQPIDEETFKQAPDPASEPPKSNWGWLSMDKLRARFAKRPA